MSLYNELSLDSAMDDGTSKYMLDGNEFEHLFSVMLFINLFTWLEFKGI